MADNTEKEKNRFPKRRKSKDNPYTIGYDEVKGSYLLTFPSDSGTIQQIYIGQTLYEVFDGFELEDLSQMNEQDRHIDASELTEEKLYTGAIYAADTVEETVERNMEKKMVHKAIKTLPKTQRRRLILYYFENFTYEQIADIEGCSPRAIKYSVDCAKNNLKSFFEKN